MKKIALIGFLGLFVGGTLAYDQYQRRDLSVAELQAFKPTARDQKALVQEFAKYYRGKRKPLFRIEKQNVSAYSCDSAEQGLEPLIAEYGDAYFSNDFDEADRLIGYIADVIDWYAWNCVYQDVPLPPVEDSSGLTPEFRMGIIQSRFELG